ncbi:unnamed protein product, partial [Toxocara canis]|uniref:POU domain, class 6, transcription factor 2 n=1 Tax=Toxocara canis TaxID=6265 RepID=A0A183V4H0_TOXCA
MCWSRFIDWNAQRKEQLNDLDGLPTKLMGMEPCSLLELGQLMSSRAMIPLSSGSLLGAQMCSLSPQLQSLFALQLAAAASQLPLAAVPAQSQTQAQPSVANCVKLGAETKLQQQQTGGGPVVCGGADRLVKPVPLKSDLCIVDESNCLSKKISTSELALNGTVNPNTALSLEKLLEENLKEPALSLAKMMLAENG